MGRSGPSPDVATSDRSAAAAIVVPRCTLDEITGAMIFVEMKVSEFTIRNTGDSFGGDDQ